MTTITPTILSTTNSPLPIQTNSSPPSALPVKTVAQALRAPTIPPANEKISAQRAFELLTGAPLNKASVPLMEAMIYDFFEEVEGIHKKKIDNLSFDYIDSLLEEIGKKAPKNLHSTLSQALKIGKEGGRHECKLTVHLEEWLETTKSAPFRSSFNLKLSFEREETRIPTWKKVLIGIGTLSLFFRLPDPRIPNLTPCQPRCDLPIHDPFLITESPFSIPKPATELTAPFSQPEDPMATLQYCTETGCEEIQLPVTMATQFIPKERSATAFLSHWMTSTTNAPLLPLPPSNQAVTGNTTLSAEPIGNSVAQIADFSFDKVKEVIQNLAPEDSFQIKSLLNELLKDHEKNLFSCLKEITETLHGWNSCFNDLKDLEIRNRNLGLSHDAWITVSTNLYKKLEENENNEKLSDSLLRIYLKAAILGFPLDEFLVWVGPTKNFAGSWYYHFITTEANLTFILLNILFSLRSKFVSDSSLILMTALLAGAVSGMLLNHTLNPLESWNRARTYSAETKQGVTYLTPTRALTKLEECIPWILTTLTAVGLLYALQKVQDSFETGSR